MKYKNWSSSVASHMKRDYGMKLENASPPFTVYKMPPPVKILYFDSIWIILFDHSEGEHGIYHILQIDYVKSTPI